jgi:hypothetical protein
MSFSFALIGLAAVAAVAVVDHPLYPRAQTSAR